MKIDNFISAFFKRKASGTTHSLIALTAGVAIGASLGVLFAPKSGRELRRKVRDMECAAVDPHETPVQGDINQQENALGKRPKSDIKSLVHQAHTEEANTEQGSGA